MKVLHINRNYLTSALHQTMVEHLEALEIENEVFVPTEDAKKKVIKPNENVVVAECFNNFDRYIYDLKQKKIQIAAEEKCDVKSFDCIHAYTLFTDGNCAMKLSDKYGIPYVVAVRNTDVNDFFKKMFYLRGRGIQIMKKAAAIFFLSKSYQDEVMSKYVPGRLRDQLMKKSFLIPNGIDDFWIKNVVSSIDNSHLTRIKQKKINLIYAGRIDKNKNISTTVKALEMLCNKGWRAKLTVVGRIEDQKEYNYIANSPLVEYHSACGKEQLIKLYRKNDIFVMPSHTETFGLVYAEAMSQGLPVIYTKGQGFDGQFSEGTIGYHVRADEASDIVHAIKKIAENYTEISGNCTGASKKFRWDSICKRYYKIYITQG